jgi:hypothetical protein
MRRFRDKNSDDRLKLLEKHLGSPKHKVHHPEMAPIMSTQDLKSPSRGKYRPKRHMFKSPNLHNDDVFNSLQPREPLKSYSSLGTLPQENERPKFNARQFLAERNALPVGTKKVNKEKQ